MLIILMKLLIACVELSQRYITDRFLPDKAIDALDEAGSRASHK
jgi:ATP-dependent Clp protease ATP-binding subunit ClpA